MKLEPGKSKYPIPPYSRIESVVVNGNQESNQMAARMIQITGVDEVIRLLEEKEVRGFPVLCAVSLEYIFFWPVPDHPYEVTGRYMPPMMEF